MGVGIVKSLAGFLLLLNFCMYVTVAAIAGWALNKAIDHHYVAGPKNSIPVGFSFSPLLFPIGNEATGFMVIFSLIAGVVGAASCLSGLHHLRVWTAESLASTASSAITAWALTLLAMGLACKEIHLHGRSPKLVALEGFIIILSATKLFYMMAIHIGFFAGNYFFCGEKNVGTTTAEPVKENTLPA
ncbi:membrane protein PM19L isoform X1 [Cryptomeria japonica]|uniref:membrane protein PM19L isoform X1 n=1 Tax=Cryptomeria japonica TaxID=3369 RepID=UPI0027DAA2AA|nr:membrane protein PM19L isoform X1 [Cryptomeria japonica]